MSDKIDYPSEWDELPKKERKQKIKELKRQKMSQAGKRSKFRNVFIIVLIIGVFVGAYYISNRKTSEQVVLEQKVDEVSLEGKVEEFEIEGRDHVTASEQVEYKTNPPTSGAHLGEAEGWGIYDKEIDDKAAVHNLEHGGIWISYKDLSEEEVTQLKEIAKNNSKSVLLSPRPENDVKIAIASWGRYMKLDSVDEALIQKYIDTYKNDSPEKLAK